MMTKKDFIALADALRTLGPDDHNQVTLDTIADFCAAQNPQFKRARWLDYVAGKCGPNGGGKAAKCGKCGETHPRTPEDACLGGR